MTFNFLNLNKKRKVKKMTNSICKYVTRKFLDFLFLKMSKAYCFTQDMLYKCQSIRVKFSMCVPKTGDNIERESDVITYFCASTRTTNVCYKNTHKHSRFTCDNQLVIDFFFNIKKCV